MAIETTNTEASAIAIDIGGGTTKLALVDRHGRVRGWRSFPTQGPDAGSFMKVVAAASRKLIEEVNGTVAGVSVAVAGFVGKSGSLEYNANLPWLEGFPIEHALAGETQLPVIVDADSNAACLAEYVFGQGKGAHRFLCLTGGTGLGVGMIAEGKLLRIAHGCLGDAGHVIVAAQGPLCSCGGRGCAEALLSTAFLAARYAHAKLQPATFRELVQDAQLGNLQAETVLAEAGEWLGIAAASLTSIFFPDRIAIAGGLSQAGDQLMERAAKSFDIHAGTFPKRNVSLIRATTGEHATLLGAAAGFFYPQLL